MKIVIGGGTGLLGKRLVRALRLRGDRVIELVRPSAETDSPASSRATASPEVNPDRLSWDGASQGPWGASLEEADAVINLAGANVGARRWSEARKREILSSRVDSTRALVIAMRSAERRPAAFICASAVGYYGSRGDEPLEESASAGRDFLADVCAAWEAEARTSEPLGIRSVQLRTGVVLAPAGEGSALDQLMLPFKMFVGGHVGSGKQWFPWIHVEDEIAAILRAVDQPRLQGPLNLVSPGIATMRDFSAALGRALHRPSWLNVPGFALHLAVGEFAEALTGGQRAVPARLQANGFQFRYPELAGALGQLVAKDNHSPSDDRPRA